MRALRICLIPVFGLLICAGLLYLYVVYDFKDTIRIIVDKESKGAYAFRAESSAFSFFKGTVQLKSSVIYCLDSTHANAWYEARIPDMYLSLASWKDLLFHKKLVVDSLSVIGAHIDIRVRKMKAGKDSIRASDILHYLESTLEHFNVHALSIKDASFTYERAGGFAPLQVGHINLAVSNFTHVNNEDDHLLGSDQVAFSLGRQHWVLPDGKHQIDFAGLRFDSKGQRFEIDSLDLSQKADTGNGEMSIQAEKLFATSRHLPAIYQREELLLDTLICIKPVLVIPANTAPKTPKANPGKVVFKSDLFNRIHVGYISVIDGKLALQSTVHRVETAATRSANLRVFNLDIDAARDPELHTDSVRLNLKGLEFSTRDSLYKLTIDEFDIRAGDVLFRNARFAPTVYNQSEKGMVFTAPSLLLKGISIPDLLERHIKASGAELREPVIMAYDHRVGKGGAPGLQPSPQKMASFYKTLHEVSELIDARDFTIINGRANFTSTGTAPIKADVLGLDAHILLHQFFISDSLIDIKHAIPSVHIGDLDVVSKGLGVHVHQYAFSGTGRLSGGSLVRVSTANGTEVTAEDVYWNDLDWDAFQRTGALKIDSLHVGDIRVVGQGAAGSPAVLPSLQVVKLRVDKLAFGGPTVGFTGAHLRINDVRSQGRYVTWGMAGVVLRDVHVSGKRQKMSMGKISFDNDGESTVDRLVVASDSGRNRFDVSVPSMVFKTGIHSSDLRVLPSASLTFFDAGIRYTGPSGKDTLSIDAKATGSADALQPSGSYDRIHLRLDSVHAQKGALTVDVPMVVLGLSHGRLDKHVLSTQIDAAVKDGRFEKGAITAASVTGVWHDDAFTLNTKSGLRWQTLVDHISVAGRFHYAGKKVTADINEGSWNPKGHILHVQGVSLLPNASREETFRKTTWQGDYMTLRGGSVTLFGVNPGKDSSLQVDKVLLQGISVDLSRDKRVPFRHGIEKPMPTKLMSTLPFPLRVDSILVRACGISYSEFSLKTGQWSTIPLTGINAAVINLDSRNNGSDTLQVLASAQLLDARIRHFSYRESYGDSLSSFAATSYASPADLTPFSSISVPAAAVSVTRGRADTAFASWTGNKYATYGTMNFFYQDLKIKLLNKAFLTWVANLLLPNDRAKPSAIFFQRDTEKFIFNYWVKAQASGLATGVGLKKSRKCGEAYRKNYRVYRLPKDGMRQWGW